MALLINFLAFQVGWFSSVIGAAKQMPWLGPVVLVFVLAIHLRQARRPHLEVGLLVICGTIGLFFESLLVVFGWVSYPSGQFSAFLAPYWIVTMWMLFGTTLNVSMGWLKGRPLLAVVFGAIVYLFLDHRYARPHTSRDKNWVASYSWITPQPCWHWPSAGQSRCPCCFPCLQNWTAFRTSW